MSFKKLLLPLLIVITISIIFYRFTDIPKYLFYDEVDFARLAVYLSSHPYIPYSELATGHSTLYFYTLLLSLKVFGLTVFALRFPAALCGVVSVILFYKIIQAIYAKRFDAQVQTIASIFAALSLITSRWYFNFARYAFEATFLSALELASIYFLFVFTQSKKYWQLYVSAVFAGLAFHSYYPGRLFFLLPLAYLLVWYKKYVVGYAIVCGLIILPLLTYLQFHPDTRLQAQMYLTNPRYSITEKIQIATHNFTSNIAMLIGSGDMVGRHNYPGKSALNLITFSLFIWGVIVTVKNYREKHNVFFLTFFILSLLPTTLASPNENPNMLRTFTMLLPIMFFIGNGVGEIMRKYLTRKLLICLCVLLFLSAAYELRTYFLFQDTVFKDDAFKTMKPLNEIVHW